MIKLKDLIVESSFLDGFKKINSGYDPKSILADFSKKSAVNLDGKKISDPGEKADHNRYIKDITTWFSKMEKNGPTVKIGDLVSVYMQSEREMGIGKIVKSTITKGDFGRDGQVAPDKQPAWAIECYTKKNIGTTKTPIEYKGNKYYYIGTLTYPQYLEGTKYAFSKLTDNV